MRKLCTSFQYPASQVTVLVASLLILFNGILYGSIRNISKPDNLKGFKKNFESLSLTLKMLALMAKSKLWIESSSYKSFISFTDKNIQNNQ